ncbi:dTDP-4-amino-4,6-dideoxygalactose transaminase, partial [Pelagibacteraceae bacterium]|nr:dTDP-4-amino-4,6-dideoxygalactose transaminase [Pelagibacteraceae bacterium]
MIPITKPFLDNNELIHIKKVLSSKILTDGYYQKKSESIIKSFIHSKFIGLTHSCTAALEISSILINLKKGDEVILPSYGFVSIANAIALRGAKPVFVEINSNDLNISFNDIKKNITKKTKAIYVIHYAGNSCEIEKISRFAKAKKIFLIEDAAHAFLGKYKNKFLGTFGDIGVFSFHETKNIVGGQAGCISVNNSKLIKRTNFILDKGTNRKNFITNYKKKIISAKYNTRFYSWVDLGSEYRAPELSSALLFSQLMKIKKIQYLRKKNWNIFKKLINKLNTSKFYLIKPSLKATSTHHILGLIFKTTKLAREFKHSLQSQEVAATFHYVPLHKSKMGKTFCKRKLPITENIYNRVVRLPLFSEMTKKEITKISLLIKNFSNL